MHQDPFLATYVTDDSIVAENRFPQARPDLTPPPAWESARALLPKPFWQSHDDTIACYWRVWELAWQNLMAPKPDSGFIAPFVDTAFNGCLFLWDSVFILEYGRYARRAFDFQRTLDNFYGRQHRDGFICREINWSTGQERYHRFDPVSTGPNVLAWSEWNHWLTLGDEERLAAVFPALVGFHRWMRFYRTWPDRTYWSSGWGCGMDNQPRMLPWPEGNTCFHHGFLSWIDATAQALLSARLLARMADILKRPEVATDMRREADLLATVVHRTLWNERLHAYVDRLRDGTKSDMVGVGGFWMLLDEQLPAERLAGMVALLKDPAHFKRPHMVPSLSAAHPSYDKTGGYWLGSVWPPTNLMVLRGLHLQRHDDLAFTIACNHVDNVTKVFTKTKTVWENYAPEQAASGKPAKGDFTGWGGLGPVAVLMESVFGLRPDVPAGRLLWDVRLTDAHGVEDYPFGRKGLLALNVGSRASASDEPKVSITSNIALSVTLRWEGGTRDIAVAPSVSGRA
jgi:hypothetical protein